MASAKTWRSIWVSEIGLDAELNKIEAGGETVFQIIYVRYSGEGKVGFRIIVYREGKSNVK